MTFPKAPCSPNRILNVLLCIYEDMLFLFVLYSFFHSSSLSLFFSTSTDSYIFFYVFFTLCSFVCFPVRMSKYFFPFEFRGKYFCFVCFSIDLTHLSLKISVIFVYVATFSRPISLVLSRAFFFTMCLFIFQYTRWTLGQTSININHRRRKAFQKTSDCTSVHTTAFILHTKCLFLPRSLLILYLKCRRLLPYYLFRTSNTEEETQEEI